MRKSNSRVFGFILLGSLFVAARGSQAQDFPVKPIRLLIGYAAGGPVDLTARRLAPVLQRELGQPVVVDYLPGAGGLLAMQQIANAAPNGYTIMLAADATQTIAPHMQKDLSFDPVKDVTPIGGVVESSLVMLVNRDLPARTLADFIAYAKARPDQVKFGSAGPGSGLHLAGELLGQRIGVRMLHVPYKGNAPALTDVMGGVLSFMFSATGSVIAAVKGGQVRALGTTARARNPSLPEVPTMDEAGLKGFYLANWYALEGPPGLSSAVVTRINSALRNALGDPALAQQLVSMGYEVAPSSPEALKSRIVSEYEVWRQVIKSITWDQ